MTKMKAGALGFILSLISILSFAQAPADSLIGYWPFNGNANDESGRGNNGSVNGATLSVDRFGQKQSCYYFDGKNDFINLTTNLSFSNFSGVSINIWIKKYDDVSSWFLMTKASNADFELLTQKDSSVVFKNYNRRPNGVNFEIEKDVSLDSSKWTFVSVVSIKTKTYFYINAQLVDSTSTGALFPNSGSFDIGKHAYFTSQGFFNGFVDDIRMYNRKLERSEIRRLYKEVPCTTYTKADTLQVLVADTLFRAIGNQTLLAKSQVFTSYLGCDSTIETYQRFVYTPVVCSDSITIFDSINIFDSITVFDSVTVYDSIKVLDTIAVIDTIKVIDSTKISVTDTLIIDLTTVGVDKNLSNTLKIFPNPSTGRLTIDNGDYGSMAKWRIIVIGSTGQTVFSSAIDQQTFELDLGDFGGKGLCFIQLYNSDNALVDVRKIVLR